MYNQTLYDKLEDKFSSFNMPIICKGIAEYMRILSEASEDKVIKAEQQYEAIWWTSAIEQAHKSINEKDW